MAGTCSPYEKIPPGCCKEDSTREKRQTAQHKEKDCGREEEAYLKDSGVSRVGLKGVSERRKCKWSVRVGASKGVNPLIKKSWSGGGGFRATRKPPWIRH